AVAKWLARILRFVDRKHARIAAKNLEQSRIVPPDKIPRFIRKVYDHLGLSFVEMLMLPRLMQRHAIERYVRLERFHVVDQVWKENKGVIVAIGHLGNWELVGLAVNLAGYPLHSLARPVENPWVDRYLHRFRTSTGQEIISKYNALGSMVATLKRKGLLVIQVDQDARHNGVYVKFFDRPAATHRSPAVLALKYGSPIIVADIYREGGLHHCVISDPIRPEDYADEPDPVKALTQEITRVFEGCVRRHPEQWFWVHDRWKTAERQARVEPQAVL
ncbi:MAG TPA: lysophospholipid acyltransferase family protein, partial [Planctomycetota bacterium]|nr:lysophospholipid acyltransferase family protein [Planctomycetota bacterium]